MTMSSINSVYQFKLLEVEILAAGCQRHIH